MDGNAGPCLQSNALSRLPATVIEHISAFLPWTDEVCLHVTCQELHSILRARLASHKNFLRDVARNWHCQTLAVHPRCKAKPSWAVLERRACQLHRASVTDAVMTISMMLAPLMAARSQQLCSPDSLDSKLVVRAHRAYQSLSPTWDELQHTPFASIHVHVLGRRVAESMVSDKAAFCERLVKGLQVLFLPQAALFFSLLLDGPRHMFPMHSQAAMDLARHARYMAAYSELLATWGVVIERMN